MEISVEQVNALIAPYFPGLFGVTFSEVGPGHSVCHVKVEPRLHNPVGILHGGVPYSLADTGMAMALMPMLTEGQNFSTVEIKVSYFKPVVSGELTCETRVINQGRRVIFLESDVRDGSRLVAKASGTYYVKAE